MPNFVYKRHAALLNRCGTVSADMNSNFYICLLVITTSTLCRAIPTLRKYKAKFGDGRSDWEDFFIVDPNLEGKDFNLPAIWKANLDSDEGWSDCGSSSIVQVKSVQLYPNPPSKGETFTVTAKLYLTEKVNSGSASIYILYNKMFPIIKTTMKVCKLVEYFGESCPMSAGDHTVVYSNTLPSYTVAGRYTGKVQASDSSGNELFCINLDMSISQ